MQNDKFNADTFRLFLELLLDDATISNKGNGKRKKILLVLDNAKYHHARILQPWLERVSDILELFFLHLPAYSPDLNAIEMLWKKTRRNVTHNHFFNSIDDLRYDLSMYWFQFAKPNGELTTLTAFI
ncbi:MAG: transposase [Proteiniphilum sp.]